MLTLKIDPIQLRQLDRELQGKSHRIPQQLSMALNGTAKRLRGVLVTQLVDEIEFKNKALKRAVAVKEKATAKKLRATIRIQKTYRVNLEGFRGTRQTKKGVSYKLEKSGPRKTVHSAFKVQAYGRKVYARKSPQRGPVQQIRGISPWGIFVKRRLRKPTSKYGSFILKKEIQRRLFVLRRRNIRRGVVV